MVIALIVSFSPISAYAATNNTNEESGSLKQKITDQCDSISGKTIKSKNGNGSVTINNVKLDMDSESFNNLSDSDKKEVYNQVTEAVNNIKNIECNVSVEKTNSRQKREVDAPVNTYKSNIDVWCGVPAIGHGYLRIRYKTSRQSGYFFDAEVLDSWITKGLTVAEWTHHYGDVEYNGRSMNVIANGTFKYPLDIKGQSTNVTMDASFKGTVN